MVRAPVFDKNGVKKGAWSKEEDSILRDYIQRCGHPNWRQLPKNAGLSRTGKSCRLRWVNYLKPGLRQGNFSSEEERLIIELHGKLGNKWSEIAARLPGRTDNCVKNYWHGHVKKRLEQEAKAINSKRKSHQTSKSKSDTDQEKSSLSEEHNQGNGCRLFQKGTDDGECYKPPLPDACQEKLVGHEYGKLSGDEVSSGFNACASFWTEPFILETSYDEYVDLYSQAVEESMSPYHGFMHDDIDFMYK